MDNFVIPDSVRIHDYKGFTIEPVVGGFMIVANCRKNTLYFSGPKGGDLSDNSDEAHYFRTCDYCYRVIDELIRDHAEWVRFMSKRKVKQENECV